MSTDFDRRCRAHQRVIDAADTYIRLHPGADAGRVLKHIGCADSEDNRLMVRTALAVEQRERQSAATEGGTGERAVQQLHPQARSSVRVR